MENVKACGVVNYLKFENLAGKKDLDELSTTEKRELMNKLVQINPYTLGKTSEIFPLLPKNKTEYCTLLEKLSKSLADSNSKTLTKEELQTFKKGLMGLQESVKNIDIDTLELSLEIPKQTFIEQVNHILSDLSDAKRKTVTNFYGFEIADGKLIGYPAIPTNDEISAKEDEKTKDAIKNLRQIVIDFSTNNKIKTNLKDNNFEQHLNETITGLAELRTIIGKIQHPTASYSLDKHTLKVLQGVVKNPKFDALSNKGKNALIIAALLHDIGKMQNQQEGSNPKKPTNNIFNIIQKLNLSEEEQQKIYSLVKNQEWFAMMNNPQNTKEDIQNLAQDAAFELRQSNTFELAKILCEASMKAADKNNSFYKTFKTKFHKMGQIIENYIKSLRKTQIILPQTTVPKASEMKNATIKRADGITNKVIYMDSANNNLCIYGFSPDTTKENFSAIVHALSYEEQLKKLDTITIMDEDALLSTSYIDCKNHETFKNHGVILDVNSNNIHAGNYYDFGTGYSKSIEMLKFSYLFYGLRKEHCTDKMTLKGDKTKHRNYIPNLIKQKMNIDDNTYALLIDKLQNCKSISDIEKISPEFAKAFIEAFDEIKQLQKGSRMKYNEILVSKPKIQAVFARDEAFEDIPVFLRKYAQDNDLPIIIF